MTFDNALEYLIYCHKWLPRLLLVLQKQSLYGVGGDSLSDKSDERRGYRLNMEMLQGEPVLWGSLS